MMTNEKYQELLRFAEETLRDQLEAADHIQNEIGWTPADEQLLEHASRLEAAFDDSVLAVAGFADQQVPLSRYEIDLAWRRGMAVNDTPPPAPEPYIGLLREYLDHASTDASIFDALSLHANQYIADARPMPVEIRRFISACLKGEMTRPSKRGAPRKSQLLNRLICGVIEDLIVIHDLRPTHNEALEKDISACAIVADAMVQLRMRPQSYSMIKYIWFNRDKPD